MLSVWEYGSVGVWESWQKEIIHSLILTFADSFICSFCHS
jgi:hypothetical protein